MTKAIKDTLATILILMLAVPQVSWADDDDPDPLGHLRGIRDAQKSKYKPYVHASYSNLLDEHYSVEFLSHQAAYKSAMPILAARIEQVAALEQEWEALRIKLSGNPGELEALAVPLRSLQSKAYLLEYWTRVARHQVEKLEKSWTDRCSEDRLHVSEELLNPTAHFPMSPQDADFSSLKADGSISINYNAPIDGGDGVGSPMAYQNNSISHIAYTVGTALCYTPAAPIGVAIIAVTFIVNVVRMALDHQEYKDLVREIDQITAEAALSLKGPSAQMIEDRCGERLKDEETFDEVTIVFSDLFSKLAEAGQKIHQRAQTVLNDVTASYEVLDDRYFAFLQTMEDEYFPTLQSNFRSLIEERFEDDLERDRLAAELLGSSVAPALGTYHESKDSPLGDRLRAEQSLLDSMLIADTALFASDGVLEVDPSRPSVWSSIVEMIEAEVER